MSELHETQNKCREPLHQRLYIVKLTVININASSFIVLAITLFQHTKILLSFTNNVRATRNIMDFILNAYF